MFFPYLFLTACFVGAIAVLWALVASLLMLRHFKSRSDRFSARTFWNPMNALVRPNLLTEAGLGLRRQVGYALIVFLGSYALAGLVGFVAKMLR